MRSFKLKAQKFSQLEFSAARAMRDSGSAQKFLNENFSET